MTPTPTATATATFTPTRDADADDHPHADGDADPHRHRHPDLHRHRDGDAHPDVHGDADLHRDQHRHAHQPPTPTLTPILRWLVRANGFEGGWAGDYAVFPQGTNAAVTGNPGEPRTGEFALEAAVSGAARYVITSLLAPTNVFTDSIWACFPDTVGRRSRRIRNWFGLSAQLPVVELYLLPDARLQLVVGGATDRHQRSRRSRACPTYSNIEVQYQAQGFGGTAALRIDSVIEVSGTHTDPDTVIDHAHRPGRRGSNPPRLRWDDHTFSTGTMWPGDLGIVAFDPTATASGRLGAAELRRRESSSRASTTAAGHPPTGIRSALSSARQTFCFQQDAAARGVTGPILGVKTIIGARDEDSIGTPGGIFLRTGGCGNPAGVDQEELNFDAGRASPASAASTRPIRPPARRGRRPTSPTPNSASATPATARAPSSRRSSWRWCSTAIRRPRFRRRPTPSRRPAPPRPRAPPPPRRRRTDHAVADADGDQHAERPDGHRHATGTADADAHDHRTPTATGTATPTATRDRDPHGDPDRNAAAERHADAVGHRHRDAARATDHATATDTPEGPQRATETDTPTVTPTASITATATPTGPTPTPTNTFPPRGDYILVHGRHQHLGAAPRTAPAALRLQHHQPADRGAGSPSPRPGQDAETAAQPVPQRLRRPGPQRHRLRPAAERCRSRAASSSASSASAAWR